MDWRFQGYNIGWSWTPDYSFSCRSKLHLRPAPTEWPLVPVCTTNRDQSPPLVPGIMVGWEDSLRTSLVPVGRSIFQSRLEPRPRIKKKGPSLVLIVASNRDYKVGSYEVAHSSSTSLHGRPQHLVQTESQLALPACFTESIWMSQHLHVLLNPTHVFLNTSGCLSTCMFY